MQKKFKVFKTKVLRIYPVASMGTFMSPSPVQGLAQCLAHMKCSLNTFINGDCTDECMAFPHPWQGRLSFIHWEIIPIL